jgi:hypothetical protein
MNRRNFLASLTAAAVVATVTPAEVLKPTAKRLGPFTLWKQEGPHVRLTRPDGREIVFYSAQVWTGTRIEAHYWTEEVRLGEPPKKFDHFAIWHG